jgi:transposase
MDIRELLRHIRGNASDRGVQRETGVHRRTVKQYRQWASEQGLLTGPLPRLVDLQPLVKRTLSETPPPQCVSSVEPYREVVSRLHKERVEVAAIWQRLQEQGYTGSYSSVRRFVRALDPRQPEVTVRVERKPGEEAQADFGFAGYTIEPETGQVRKTWAFVMTLSWSRHQYVEFVFNQRVETWLECHRHAFEFFGGVPQRIVIDNLKAAITRACWDDPQVQQAYRECAEHYGFMIAPCRPRTPEHKGKVEQGGVHYVQRNFLGGRTRTTITQANQDVRVWCTTTAGQRIHGTTKERPLVRFQETEHARLKLLPETAYDLAIWKVVKLHRDCHIVFDGAYYSAPFRLVGQSLRVRGSCRRVIVYTMDWELMACHSRAMRPGERHTNPLHLPTYKVPGLVLDRSACLVLAAQIGSATEHVVATWLADPVIDRLPMVGRLLRLRQRFGDDRLQVACARAVRFDDISYSTIKRILINGLDRETPPAEATTPSGQTFVRSADELVGHLCGGVAWN